MESERLKNLIKIIAEAVYKYKSMQKLNVAAVVFDEKNRFYAEKSAKAVSENAKIYKASDFLETFLETEGCEGLDVLVLDYLPVSYMAEVSLGFCNNKLSKILGKMVQEGKVITVLNKSPEITENTPVGYIALLDGYKKMLESYGFSFMYERRKETKTKTAYVSESSDKPLEIFFDGRVLTAADILQIPAGGNIFVGEKTIITDLARERIISQNIKIRIG